MSKVLTLYEIPGLNSVTNCGEMFQDRQGFIWLATLNGLYKFDGYRLTHYLFDPTQPEKIAGPWVGALSEDNSGNIWIGVFGVGLQKMNPSTGKFTLYKSDPANPDALIDNKITQTLFFNGRLWVNTQGGLCSFSPETEKFRTYSGINTFDLITHGDDLWIISNNVLSVFSPLDDKFVAKDTLKSRSSNFSPILILNDNLYITDYTQIFRYNLKSKELELISLENTDLVSRVFYSDNYLLVSRISGKFQIFNIEKGILQTPELSPNINAEDLAIYGFIKLKNGDVWAGGKRVYKVLLNNNGIETFVLKKNGKKLTRFTISTFSEWEPRSLGIGKSVLADFNNLSAIRASIKYPSLAGLDSAYDWSNRYVNIYVDKSKDSWIALFERPLYRVTFFRFSYATKKLDKLGSISNTSTIFGLTKLNDDLYLATWTGLLKWNIPSSKYVIIGPGRDEDSTKLSSDGLRSVFKDRDDDLWIATQTGLNLKRKDQNFFIRFFSRPGDTTALSFNSVSTVKQDRSGLIWIGTLGGGVNSFNKTTGKFSWYTTKQGLASDNIVDIVIDDVQNVWLSQENGSLSRINPQTLQVENFSANDGILALDENQALKMSDGSIIFSGDVLSRIWPDKIRKDKFDAPIIITDFKLFNRSILIGGNDSVLKKDINSGTSITLRHNQRVISFEFAALDMSHPDQRTYAYQLEGFDPDWQFVDKKREVTYTNLSQGNYVFRVKSSNRNGEWQEMKNPVYIKILPPWWQTWWAYTLYVFIFGSFVWAFVRYRSRQLTRAKRMLEEKVTQRTNELSASLKELKEAQSQLVQREKMASLGELTAGIAHEIQNPLNFVNNFSEVNTELIDEMQQVLKNGNTEEAITLSDDIKQNLEKITHHGKRADAIVKGMLQHSRITTGQKELTDINALVDEYLRLSYHGMRAKDKTFNVALRTDFDQAIGKVNLIPQDIGRVLLNLYNNAFYALMEKKKLAGPDFEPKLEVSTRKTDNILEITVRDNGLGIPGKLMEKIFLPFFTTKPTGQGTGLGLSLSNDIITKGHGGILKWNRRKAREVSLLLKYPFIKE